MKNTLEVTEIYKTLKEAFYDKLDKSKEYETNSVISRGLYDEALGIALAINLIEDMRQ